jgi:hypothetical protein
MTFVYLMAGCGFFALCLGFVHGADRLREDRP